MWRGGVYSDEVEYDVASWSGVWCRQIEVTTF